MGLLDEPGLDRLLEIGCPKCGAHRLTFTSYVDGMLPIMGSEPVGKMTWVYDGEKFVDGVYEVACAGVQGGRVRGRSSARAATRPAAWRARSPTPNGWPVPAAVSVVRRRPAPLRRLRSGARRLRGQARGEGAQLDGAARGRLSRLPRRLPRLRHRRGADRRPARCATRPRRCACGRGTDPETPLPNPLPLRGARGPDLICLPSPACGRGSGRGQAA